MNLRARTICSLFCIRNFIDNFCQVEEILTAKPLGLTNIQRFFEYKISVYHSEGAKGCLVFNSLMEEESISKEANKAVMRFMKGMKGSVPQHLCCC